MIIVRNDTNMTNASIEWNINEQPMRSKENFIIYFRPPSSTIWPDAVHFPLISAAEEEYQSFCFFSNWMIEAFGHVKTHRLNVRGEVYVHFNAKWLLHI